MTIYRLHELFIGSLNNYLQKTLELAQKRENTARDLSAVQTPREYQWHEAAEPQQKTTRKKDG